MTASIYIYIYITYKNMEPVDIDATDRDGLGKEDDKWDDGKMNELEENSKD